LKVSSFTEKTVGVQGLNYIPSMKAEPIQLNRHYGEFSSFSRALEKVKPVSCGTAMSVLKRLCWIISAVRRYMSFLEVQRARRANSCTPHLLVEERVGQHEASHRFCRRARHAAPPAETKARDQISPQPRPKFRSAGRVGSQKQHLRVGEALGPIHAERFEHLRGRAGRPDP
jgi:hypothetical protein